jgi:chemotaxis protein CheY-P-specific phosphatase CheC
MSEQIKETLCRVAEGVMEKLAFMMSFPETEEISDSDEHLSAAGISFSGVLKGTLIVAVSAQMLPKLTGNMLGLDDDEDTTPEQEQDALKELINVICGNFLPDIGKQYAFHIEPPQIIIGDPQTYLKTVSPNSIPISVTLTMEEGRCYLFLAMENYGGNDENSGGI